MNRTLRYLGGLFLQPRKTLQSLHHDPQRIGFGFLGVLILAAVYFAGISVSIALNVMHLPKYLVINIPVEQYYGYERFFVLPVGLAGVILAAGVIRLAAQWMKGQGSYEGLFALLGFGMMVNGVVMGIPDLIISLLIKMSLLPPRNWNDVGLHIYLATLWYLLLTILSVKEVERLSWGRSILIGLIGFAVNGMVSYIFIR